ncbi:MAG: high-affinity nickel-transport family protein [Candidatus Rokubacteria bacterium]|nr:high-affinity nickel-transport family protein [Candidatus Rokubacteria bacterium]
MASLAWVIGLGFLLGIQHATDPDHVLAVATIASREPRWRSGVLVGILWGLGHALTLTVVGGTIVLLSLTVPPAVALSLELAVAVMLVGLGLVRLAWCFRGVRRVHPEHARTAHEHGHRHAFHSHVHTHDGVAHRHPHLHPAGWLLAALGAVGVGRALRSVAIGVVHGLAGSAVPGLLILATIQNPVWAVAYLAVFGAGTMAGMMAIAAVLVLPFAISARRFAGINHVLSVGTGLLALAVGCFLVYRIGFVERLLTG